MESGKRILITGGSGDIGQAISKRLAFAGYDVVVHYNNNEERANTIATEIESSGGRASTLGFNVCNRVQTHAMLEEDIESNGSYYGVICNAGIHSDSAFPMMSDTDWDSVIDTNLDGFYNVLKPVVMPMISNRKPGRIVAISSVSGIAGNRGQVNYSAAKAGLIGAAKALGIELAKRKITVNCVAPGLIETSMTESLAHEEIMKLIPMRRAGTPDEVAAAVEFLCSEDAAYITRQTLTVDGGLI